MVRNFFRWSIYTKLRVKTFKPIIGIKGPALGIKPHLSEIVVKIFKMKPGFKVWHLSNGDLEYGGYCCCPTISENYHLVCRVTYNYFSLNNGYHRFRGYNNQIYTNKSLPVRSWYNFNSHRIRKNDILRGCILPPQNHSRLFKIDLLLVKT